MCVRLDARSSARNFGAVIFASPRTFGWIAECAKFGGEVVALLPCKLVRIDSSVARNGDCCVTL